jgi:nucleoid DNA-binding protein
VLEDHLKKGEIVRLEPLGSFQISVKGTGSTSADMISQSNVSSANIIYRPGKKLKKLLSNLSFVRKK